MMIDVLTITADELQSLLSKGDLTSLELVHLYRNQIEQHNHRGMKLNAVLNLVPEAIVEERARFLDNERAEGRVRSVLHGIPITVKVGSCGLVLLVSSIDSILVG